MTNIICVDASLIIRLVLGQGEAAQFIWAEWMGSDSVLIAPDLIYYEITNVLYRYARQEYISDETARLSLEAALALPIRVYEDKDLHRSAMGLAEQLGLPAAYDAHYLALAQAQDAEFWTTDRRLAQECPFEWVKLAES